jgi:hypothetical protein
MSAAKVEVLRVPTVSVARQPVKRRLPKKRIYEAAAPPPEVAAPPPQEEEVELPDVSEETIALAVGTRVRRAALQTNEINQALGEIITGSEKASEWHSKRGALYGRAYYALGLPAVILATLAGATALASAAGRVPAAIIALVSAALGAAATFLNSGGQRAYHQEMASQWYMIAGEAKIYRFQDVSWVTEEGGITEEGRKILKGLLDRQAQLLKGRPVVLASESK